MTGRLYRYRYLLLGMSVLAIFGLIAGGYFIRTSRIDIASGGIADWSYYGRDQEGTRYAPLDQINRDNVGYLEIAWEYHKVISLMVQMAGRRPHFRPRQFWSTESFILPRSTVG